MKNYKNLSEQFCHDILELDINRSKAVTNLVMALASHVEATSVVELSLSPVYHYEYSSIFKAIKYIAKDAEDFEIRAKTILEHCLKWYVLKRPTVQKRLLLQTDVTPIARPYSPTLEKRQYIKQSNTVIKSNKPITIGYPLSSINLSCADKWSLPLIRSRVDVEETESEHAVGQLQGLLPKLLKELNCELVINTTDSSYTHPAYLAPLYEQKELVCISRFRYGCKVYTQAKSNNPLGATKIYGDCFYLLNADRIYKGKVAKTGRTYEKLQTTIHTLDCDDTQTLQAQTKKGRPLIIELYRWNNLKIRSKQGNCMKHKPFDLVAARVIDAQTGALLYTRDMFFCVFGQKKDEITTEQTYTYYRRRYDIEPSFRFNKQHLFLDSYLCEGVQHLDNFLLINQLANWLLYVAADEVAFLPRKWEENKSKATKEKKTATTKKTSIAKARRSSEKLFSTFDSTPFLPELIKKGKGKVKEKRPHYFVVKKEKKGKKVA